MGEKKKILEFLLTEKSNEKKIVEMKGIIIKKTHTLRRVTKAVDGGKRNLPLACFFILFS